MNNDNTKDEFDLIGEFIIETASNSGERDMMWAKLEQFKASKQKPKPERVLDISYLQEDHNAIHHYSFTTTKWLPKEAIKSAIHNLLNGTSTLMDAHQHALEEMSKMFTKEQLEEAEKAAFRGGREQYTKEYGRREYPTFEDYKKSKL